MTSDNAVPKPLPEMIANWRFKQLPRSGLFEEGAIEDAPDAESFVRRLNCHVFTAQISISAQSPASFKAVKSDGRLDRYAELMVFGHWLFQRMPGRKPRSGPPHDPYKLIKVVAVGIKALEAAHQAAKRGEDRPAGLSPKEIARLWNRSFGMKTISSDHSAALRSLKGILPDYLTMLKTGNIEHDRMRVTSSPLMAELYAALGRGKFAAPAASRLIVTAAPTDFEIPLSYFSPEAEKEYRGVAAATPPPLPGLRYTVEPVRPSSSGGQLRSDRIGRHVLRPDVDVRKVFTARALIDRTAFTIDTKMLTSYSNLHRLLDKLGATGYVLDRTLKQNDWSQSLPKLDLLKQTGQHFAILLQDPTPELLRAVLSSVRDLVGIVGDVRPFLLELAVDFYPLGAGDENSSLLARERCVALLQRHHWASSAMLLESNPDVARHIDPRQIYAEGKKPRYLFADQNEKYLSDSSFHEPSVRRRILDAKAGNDLYLNSTIYRGNLNGPLRTNIQHKVADQRNSKEATRTELPFHERRGRAEVTLTSLEALEAVGLVRVDDLADFRFRTLTRNLLRFRLATCAPDAASIHEMIRQVKTRGIHGVEMMQRAARHQERETTRPKPRQTDREGWGLEDWTDMNEMVGAALDRLKKRWGRF